jgi:hypothetical protein
MLGVHRQLLPFTSIILRTGIHPIENPRRGEGTFSIVTIFSKR